MKELESWYLGSSSIGRSASIPAGKSPFTPVSSIRKRIESFQQSALSANIAHAQSKLPPIPLPVFDGNDLDVFLKDFERWMRLSGVDVCAENVKLDWLIQACAPKVKKLVEKVVEEKVSLIDVLNQLEALFPKLENDISLRSAVEKLPSLPASPDPSVVAQLFVELEEIFSRMQPGSMSDQEKFLVLIKNCIQKRLVN